MSSLRHALRLACLSLLVAAEGLAQDAVTLPAGTTLPAPHAAKQVINEPCLVGWTWRNYLDPDKPEFNQQKALEAQLDQWIAADTASGPGYMAGPLVIPVVVHVLLPGDPSTRVPPSIVDTQIAALNRDLGCSTDHALISTLLCVSGCSDACPFVAQAEGPCLKFVRAERSPGCEIPVTPDENGITYTTLTIPDPPPGEEPWDGSFDLASDTQRAGIKSALLGGVDPWDEKHYLNVWVVDVSEDPSVPHSVVADTSFPDETGERQGIIISAKVFGDSTSPSWPASVTVLESSHSRGCSLSHEVGHYFFLYHLWGSGLGPPNPVCSGDDQVPDTPPQQAPHYADCDACSDSCPTIASVSTSTGPDLCEDFMDYSDDARRVMFTAGQVERLRAMLFTWRADLLNSLGAVPPVPGTDTWIADAWDDNGSEPDATHEPIYASPDIWVRHVDDGLEHQSHQSPLAKSGPQYVYVRVRNRGCEANGTQQLKLYWAKAGTGLSWEWPWTGATSSGVQIGGPIGSLDFAPPNPGESMIFSFEWTPPDPEDFASMGSEAGHVCLLARIESARLPPLGMTYSETDDLAANVRQNNGIAWKNVWVVDPSSQQSSTSIMYMANGLRKPDRIWIITRGGWRDDLVPLTSVATVTVSFLDQPRGAWFEKSLAASRRSGLRPEDKGKFDPRNQTLKGDRNIFGPFDLNPGEVSRVAFMVQGLKKDGLDPGTYVLDVQQWRGRDVPERLVGGGVLGLTVPAAGGGISPR